MYGASTSETTPKLYAFRGLPFCAIAVLDGGFVACPKRVLEAFFHFYAGTRSVRIRARFGRWLLEMEAKENPGDQQALCTWLCLPAMGWKDAALAEISRAKKSRWIYDGGAFPCRRPRRRIALSNRFL